MLAPCLIDGDPMFLAPIAHLRALSRLATLTALACGTLVLNGCGGGDRATPYVPTRMVSFGDENSLIDTYTDPAIKLKADGSTQSTLKGLVYTLNAVTATTNGYVCPGAASTTSYTACDSSNGSTTRTMLDAPSVDQWYVTPASANVLTRVQSAAASASDATVNHRDLDYVWNCTGSVIWTQVIAHAFRLGYASYNGAVGQCPTDGYSNAYTYAAYGAKSADVSAQIAAHLSELGSGTLVTVMAGQWDILELYDAVKASTITQASAEAELRNRAGGLASAVIAVINQGAKVVVSLTPDLGESPMAYTAGDTALLKALTTAFNDALYINNLADQKKVPKGGRVVAGVNPETLTNTTTRSTSYVYGTAICPTADASGAATPVLFKDPVGNAVPAPATTDGLRSVVKYCNTATTTLPSNYTSYMWADSIHFSPLGHGSIGSSGYTRASNQF
jgi:hypothetical protein